MFRYLYLSLLVLFSVNTYAGWKDDINYGKNEYLKSDKFKEHVSLEKINDLMKDPLSAPFIRKNILSNNNIIRHVSYKYIDPKYKAKISNIDYYIDLELLLNEPTSTIYICFGDNEIPVSKFMPDGMIELDSCDDEISFYFKIIVKTNNENTDVFEVLENEKVIFRGIYLNNESMFNILKKYINSIGGWYTRLKIIGANENINEIARKINLINGIQIDSIDKYRSGFDLLLKTKLNKRTIFHKISNKLNNNGFINTQTLEHTNDGLLLRISEENEFIIHIDNDCICDNLFKKINDSGIYISGISSDENSVKIKSYLSKEKIIKKLNLKNNEGKLFYENELVWYQWFLDIFNKIKIFFKNLF